MYIYGLLLLLFSDDVFARSIKGVADKMANESARIGTVIGLIGLIVGGIAMAAGRQDAGRLLTCAVIGILVILMKDSILSFLQSLV